MIPKTKRLQKYKKLHVVSYGLECVARPLLLFFSSENRLLWFRYREYDLAHLKLVFEFSIYRVWSRFDDTAYWGFLGVGTTFDIFQNIHILYLQYGVSVFSGYGVLILFPLWSFGECRHRYAGSSLMDTAYWLMVRVSVLNDGLKSMHNAEKRGKRQVTLVSSSTLTTIGLKSPSAGCGLSVSSSTKGAKNGNGGRLSTSGTGDVEVSFNAVVATVVRAQPKDFMAVKKEWAAIRIQSVFRSFLVIS
ncbi:ribonuclease H-like domain-containing protein [Tanacetum coccineum]